MDSLERSSDALPTLECAAQDASKEAYASLGDETLAEGPPKPDKVVGEAPSFEAVAGLLLSARQFNLAIGGPCRPSGPNRLVLNLSVKPMKWDHSPMDTSIPGPDST